MGEKFKVMQRVMAAWTVRDIDAVLSHLADDIVWHYAVAIAPPLKGKASARKLLEKMAGETSRLNWRLFDYAERGERLFIEGAEDYLDKDGATVVTPYAGVLEFRGELICAWRDYLDIGAVEAQRSGKGTPTWIAALAGREPVDA
jgi:limonene-1,2-epoxide hydrolase